MKKEREVFNKYSNERYETPIWDIKCIQFDKDNPHKIQVLHISSLLVPSVKQTTDVFEQMLIEEYKETENV